MTQVTKKYFGKTMTLSVKDTETSPETYEIGVLKGVEFILTQDIKELEGMGSVLRQGVGVAKKSVKVTVKYAQFDGKLMGKILGTTTADEDIEGSTATGQTHAEILDSSVPIFFDITGTVTESGGDTSYNIKAKATNVVFTNLPFSVPEDDFIVIALEGTADRLDLEYKTPT